MSTLINALTAQFDVPSEPPASALAHWRKTRPSWLDPKYKEVADSYNSVTWEWRHTPLSMKIVGGGLFGGRTVFRLTALFEDSGTGGSRITLNGEADAHTREAIKEAANSYVDGGIV